MRSPVIEDSLWRQYRIETYDGDLSDSVLIRTEESNRILRFTEEDTTDFGNDLICLSYTYYERYIIIDDTAFFFHHYVFNDDYVGEEMVLRFDHSNHTPTLHYFKNAKLNP